MIPNPFKTTPQLRDWLAETCLLHPLGSGNQIMRSECLTCLWDSIMSHLAQTTESSLIVEARRIADALESMNSDSPRTYPKESIHSSCDRLWIHHGVSSRGEVICPMINHERCSQAWIWHTVSDNGRPVCPAEV